MKQHPVHTSKKPYCSTWDCSCHTNTKYHSKVQASGNGVSVDPSVSDAFFAGQFGDALNIEEVFTIQVEGRDMEVASYSIQGGRS